VAAGLSAAGGDRQPPRRRGRRRTPIPPSRRPAVPQSVLSALIVWMAPNAPTGETV